MPNFAFTAFIIFGLLWVLMGTLAVIALLKSDKNEIRLGKQGLLVALPILIPIAITLLYQVIRSLTAGHPA